MNKKISVWFLILGLITAVAVTFIVLGNNDESQQSATNTSNSSTNVVVTNQVDIATNQFLPRTIRVKKGETVTWKNGDQAEHTVESDESSKVEFKSNRLSGGDTFSFTFNEAGTYAYHCGT